MSNACRVRVMPVSVLLVALTLWQTAGAALQRGAQPKPGDKPEADKQSETRERTIARAWREVPGTLVLRPQPDGWDVPVVAGAPTDAGHRTIADELEDAFRVAGLAKNP